MAGMMAGMQAAVPGIESGTFREVWDSNGSGPWGGAGHGPGCLASGRGSQGAGARCLQCLVPGMSSQGFVLCGESSYDVVERRGRGLRVGNRRDCQGAWGNTVQVSSAGIVGGAGRSWSEMVGGKGKRVISSQYPLPRVSVLAD